MEGSLFQNVRYFIADDVQNATEVKNILKQGGGMREFYLNELVTHIIAESPPDPATLPISDVTVIKADWAIMSNKCGALLPVKAFEPKNDKLFTGVVFCCSKLGCSDMEKLVVLTMFYGGKMQRMLDSTVTHLVTMDTSGAKYECAQKHSDVVKVVTPDWILDSIDAGQKQDEALYHPSCVRLKGSHHHHARTTSLSSPTLQRCNGDSTTEAATGEGERDREGEKNETQTDTSDVAKPSVTAAESGEPSSTMEEQPEEEGERGQSTAEQLLDGLVVVFSDYQDCMDEDTMDKWKQVVEQHGGRVFNRYDPDQCTHLLALNKSSDVFHRALSDGKCIASAHWLNDVLTDQKLFPPSNPLHFPTAFKWLLPGADRYSMSLTNYTGNEREIVKDMFRITGVSFTGHLSRENTHLVCKRPEGKKYEKALEWGIQVVNAGFLAEIIHNGQVPAVLFPRHTKLGGPDEFSSSACFEAAKLLRPWQSFMSRYSELHPALVDEMTTHSVLSSLPPPPVPTLTETSSSGAKRGRSSTDDEPPAQAKKARVEAESSAREDDSSIVVLFTGISQSVVKNLKQIIVRFGGRLTDIGRECTHIVSPRVTRTVKFLSGISVCRHIVTPEWVEECGRAGRLVDEGGYVLRDRDAEEMFDMNIAVSLTRAKKKQLLTGLCFYATENVQPPFANLKEIIECAGGVLWTQEDLKAHGLSGLGNSQFIVISNPEDIAAGHCSDFFKHNISVYNAELVLTGVLRQKLDFKTNQLSPVQ